MIKKLEKLATIPKNEIKLELQKMGKNVSITHGEYSVKSIGISCDHAWNHMDQEHRPIIHNTYTESVRIARDENFALSLTKVKFSFFKFWILVADVHVSREVCYQSYSLFNLIYVLHLSKSLNKEIAAEWYIASHWLLKFLHPFLDKKIYKINEVQIAQDIPIIQQRTRLRKLGYKFSTDEPNYLNSNSVTPGTTAPKLLNTEKIILPPVTNGMEKVASASVELLIERSADKISIWPTICMHQGGDLKNAKLCQGKLQCPWHGQKASGVILTATNTEAELGPLHLSLSGNELSISNSEFFFKDLSSPREKAFSI